MKSPPSSGSATGPSGTTALAALCEDDWDNEEWGTLQEEPVSPILSISMKVGTLFFNFFYNIYVSTYNMSFFFFYSTSNCFLKIRQIIHAPFFP